MLINQKQVKHLYKDAYGKRVSKEVLENINSIIIDLVVKSCRASNGHKTVLGRDVANFSVRVIL